MKNIQKKACTVLLTILWVFISGPAICAENSWYRETTAREVCFLFTLYQDWQQTRAIANNTDQFQETNPISGSHPWKKNVDLYFAGCAMGHAFIAYMIPPHAFKIWQTTWIGVQTSVFEGNSNMGLRKEIVMEYRVEFSIPF
jgi:hypothetical protein